MEKNIKIYKTPEFNSVTGYLKSGIHLMTISELLTHPILGATQERKELIKSLKLACTVYWGFNITGIYANGSFATMKPIPADIDGYIQISFKDPSFKDLITSGSIWGNFNGKDHLKDKCPMWYEHKLEFYLYDPDLKNNSFNASQFFTHSREGVERGIIKVIR
jgi:hypothetical protein